MAYRLITQVVVIGSRVLGRAFTEAYKQANASSQYARAQAKAGGGGAGGGLGGGSSGRASLASGMTLEEAADILNVPRPPAVSSGGPSALNPKTLEAAKAYNMEEVLERFKRLFDANDPQNGGSFYLQSKVLRARERIEAEMRPVLERAAEEAEAQASLGSKLYKDR